MLIRTTRQLDWRFRKEATLSELLAERIVQQVMARDGVDEIALGGSPVRCGKGSEVGHSPGLGTDPADLR